MKNIVIAIALWTPMSCIASQLTDLYLESKDSIVLVESTNSKGEIISSGTGFYISNGKRIATNYHIIKEASSIRITNTNGTKNYVKNAHYISKIKDIAILSVKHAGKPLNISRTPPQIGTDVLTIGNPRGFNNTISSGIVSGRRVYGGATFIQTTVPISPGSSGGPLMTINGDVIGITTFYIKESQNVNFAVSAMELNTLAVDDNYIAASGVIKTVDITDPASVGQAFFYALKNNDIDRAITYVRPEEQDKVQNEIQKSGLPKLPKEMNFSLIKIGGTRRGYPMATVGIAGSEIGCEVINRFNRWWVAK